MTFSFSFSKDFDWLLVLGLVKVLTDWHVTISVVLVMESTFSFSFSKDFDWLLVLVLVLVKVLIDF